MDATITTTINTTPYQNLQNSQQAQETIKQPAPNVQENYQNAQQSKQNLQDNSNVAQGSIKPEGTKYKLIKNPDVGVIQLPFITNTPVTDTLELKSKLNPYTKYKTSDGKKKLFSIHSLTFGAIMTCGIAGIISLFKKK